MGKLIDWTAPTWCEYCSNVHIKGQHTKPNGSEPRWVSCSRDVNELVAAYRHLILPGNLTTLCGCTASELAIWRGSNTKPICPRCYNLMNND